MPEWFYIITSILLPLTSVISVMFVLIQLRGSSNINKSNYLLTLDKYFAENKGMQEIYKILSDNIECQLVCNFEQIDSSHLSTYFTFLESFYPLIKKRILAKSVLTVEELYNLFGHRIFSMLHNKKTQMLEIYKFKDHYDNLFALHENLIIYCIKKERKVPNIQNAQFFLEYGKYKEKHKQMIEKQIKKAVDMNIKKCNKTSHGFDLVFMQLNVKLENITMKENGMIRRAEPADLCAILAIQDKIIDELSDKSLFIPTEKNNIKKYIENKDVFFACVKTPCGVGAYSYTLFNDSSDYIVENFKNKKVALFDSVVVMPELRGNRLQKTLKEFSCNQAKKANQDIITAIVSPNNKYSLDNFTQNGFEILKTIKFESFDRYLVYKNL